MRHQSILLNQASQMCGERLGVKFLCRLYTTPVYYVDGTFVILTVATSEEFSNEFKYKIVTTLSKHILTLEQKLSNALLEENPVLNITLINPSAYLGNVYRASLITALLIKNKPHNKTKMYVRTKLFIKYNALYY